MREGNCIKQKTESQPPHTKKKTTAGLNLGAKKMIVHNKKQHTTHMDKTHKTQRNKKIKIKYKTT
jgi:hypothetical protein